jgi:RNA polymerase sigma-32 factor
MYQLMTTKSAVTPKPRRRRAAGTAAAASPRAAEPHPDKGGAPPAAGAAEEPTAELVEPGEGEHPADLVEGDADLEALAGAALGGLGDEDADGDGDILADDFVAGSVPPVGDGAVVEAPAGRRTGSLVKTDPLTAYMHEIRRYPLLSREEEHTLASEYTQTRDPKIGRRLITANLRLVVKIAHEYKRAYHNLLDLVQEGNLGLLQAVQKYDPHRGVKLSSYAAWWIRAYMLKFILNNWRLVKIGTTQAQRKLFFNLSKEREKLELAGFVPTSKLLAERLNVPEQEVTDMQLRLAASETSLDAPIGRDDEGGRTQIEMLESASASRPDVTAESDEFRGLLREKLQAFEKTLSGREQTLFHERLVSDQPLTLQEVGERYNISRERARQIEARLLSRLKVYLKKELGDAVQVAMGLD